MCEVRLTLVLNSQQFMKIKDLKKLAQSLYCGPASPGIPAQCFPQWLSF